MRIESSVCRWLVLAVLILLTIVPTVVRAQSITDPTRAEFNPSPDHNSTASDGTPLLSRYDLEFYMLGAAAPFQTQSLDKPAPGTDGIIRVPLGSTAMPTGVVFESRVRAVGPGGSSTSNVSNSFMYSVSCTYAVTPTSHSFGATGGAGTQSVTTGAGCDWMSTVNVSWVTLAASAVGSGNGSVDFSVSPNPTASPRTGTLMIGGQAVTITQAGTTPCSFTVSTPTTSFPATGGSGSSSVNAGSGCGWTATSASNWITINSGATGSGPGGVAFTVAANTGTSARQGTLTVAGQTVQITQGGASTCSFTLTPTSQSFGPSGGNGSAAVTTTSTCGWTASSGASWISISSGASGTGTSSVAYSVASYTGTSTRTGTLTIAGRSLTVTQTGQTTNCTATVTPTAAAFGSASAQGSFSVTASSGCSWTAQSSVSWLTVTGGASGSGNGVVTINVANNTGSQSRAGTLTIAGQTVSVTQSTSSNGQGPGKPGGFRVWWRR